MILNFKEFLHENYLAAQLLPSETKTAKIQLIELKKNPILIVLEDKTKIYLSWDQYRRLNEEPSVGKKLTVNFQKHPKVQTTDQIQINYIKIS